MIYVELCKEDLVLVTRTEVQNPPGMLFGGTSPLLKPFMKKLEHLLPTENKGRGDSYTLNMLYSHIGSVYADENMIRVEGDEKIVVITKDELATMIGDKYPASDHRRLNLPGLFFLQSSPGFQAAVVTKMKREHNLRFPEGRRTLRYIFHMTVISIDADKDNIRVGLDLDRLPKIAGALASAD